LFLLDNNFTSVVLPAPEGEEITIIIPVQSEIILKNWKTNFSFICSL